MFGLFYPFGWSWGCIESREEVGHGEWNFSWESNWDLVINGTLKHKLSKGKKLTCAKWSEYNNRQKRVGSHFFQ